MGDGGGGAVGVAGGGVSSGGSAVDVTGGVVSGAPPVGPDPGSHATGKAIAASSKIRVATLFTPDAYNFYRYD